MDPSSAIDLASALPDGVVVADATGEVLAANRTARDMLDTSLQPGSALNQELRLRDHYGRDWLQVNHPYDTLGIVTKVPEQPWLLPNGEEVLVTARLTRSGHLGRVERLGISLRSGRGRSRLDRERSDLVATVAHELRSPLTGVKGFVQALLARWDKLNDEQRKLMLHTVNADADRLARLISELLDVARIDTGRIQLATRPVDPVVLLGRVVESVSAGTSREVALTLGELPQIQADPDKFSQVFTNLLENGVRHGEGAVTVSADHGSRYVSFRVDDEGDGIPMDLRRRVFTKFWTTGAGGTGLGMYLVNGLVRAHHGTVSIGDSPSGGARITVVWPVAPD